MRGLRFRDFIIFGSIIFLAGCASKALVCDNNWQDHPVKVDGRAKEWEVPLRFYDPESKLNYAITNDESNLYYCIRITDDKQEMRALGAGMQVWIDTLGNRALQVGIQYPFVLMNSKVSDSAGVSAARNQFSEYAKEMQLSGFIAPIGGATQVPNVYGINVAIARDSSGVLIYEGSIPFKTFCKSAITANKVFGITIILNPLPEGQKKAHRANPVGGMPGNGMGGMGAMGNMGASMTGRGGGRNNSGDEQDDANTRPAVVRLRVRLASKTM